MKEEKRIKLERIEQLNKEKEEKKAEIANIKFGTKEAMEAIKLSDGQTMRIPKILRLYRELDSIEEEREKILKEIEIEEKAEKETPTIDPTRELQETEAPTKKKATLNQQEVDSDIKSRAEEFSNNETRIEVHIARLKEEQKNYEGKQDLNSLKIYNEYAETIAKYEAALALVKAGKTEEEKTVTKANTIGRKLETQVTEVPAETLEPAKVKQVESKETSKITEAPTIEPQATEVSVETPEPVEAKKDNEQPTESTEIESLSKETDESGFDENFSMAINPIKVRRNENNTRPELVININKGIIEYSRGRETVRESIEAIFKNKKTQKNLIKELKQKFIDNNLPEYVELVNKHCNPAILYALQNDMEMLKNYLDCVEDPDKTSQSLNFEYGIIAYVNEEGNIDITNMPRQLYKALNNDNKYLDARFPIKKPSIIDRIKSRLKQRQLNKGNIETPQIEESHEADQNSNSERVQEEKPEIIPPVIKQTESKEQQPQSITEISEQDIEELKARRAKLIEKVVKGVHEAAERDFDGDDDERDI